MKNGDKVIHVHLGECEVVSVRNVTGYPWVPNGEAIDDGTAVVRLKSGELRSVTSEWLRPAMQPTGEIGEPAKTFKPDGKS